MTVSLQELNTMPEAEAAAKLRDCCGSTKWVEHMLKERPFGSAGHLLTAAETVWKHTGPDDWEEAFTHHPRIGERHGQTALSAEARAWAMEEQALAAQAGEAAGRALDLANAAYERLFGRTYIVCATGLTADDILADLHRRLTNEPDVERKIAAAEQAKITALRLRKLIGEDL